VIIILTVGVLGRPFPPVIFTPDGPPNYWKHHIEQPEEETSQMGEVSHPASCPPERGEEFDQPEKDDEVFGRDGKQEVEEDGPVWKEPAKGEKDAVNCSRSSDDRDELVGGEEDGAESGSNAAEKEITDEFARTPKVFQLPSEHPECQKIEEKMRDPTVKEDVSDELPDKSLLPDEKRNQAQIDTEMSPHHVHHHLQEEDPHHDEHQFLDDRGQAISKSESGAIIGHDIALSDLSRQ
jgi:hypothetical protein